MVCERCGREKDSIPDDPKCCSKNEDAGSPPLMIRLDSKEKINALLALQASYEEAKSHAGKPSEDHQDPDARIAAIAAEMLDLISNNSYASEESSQSMLDAIYEKYKIKNLEGISHTIGVVLRSHMDELDAKDKSKILEVYSLLDVMFEYIDAIEEFMRNSGLGENLEDIQSRFKFPTE